MRRRRELSDEEVEAAVARGEWERDPPTMPEPPHPDMEGGRFDPWDNGGSPVGV
jgi:hypothetical protein